MWYLLSANTTFAYTHADTLRGSNGTSRKWWDVIKYDLSVRILPDEKRIIGTNEITFKIVSIPSDSMQIDLQDSMQISQAIIHYPHTDNRTYLSHQGNVWWVRYSYRKLKIGETYRLTVSYSGKPRSAIHPPWDGGFIWGKDSVGKPWISVACQGLGASSWWPCKDAQWDEPDSGMSMKITIPDTLSCISNGHLVNKTKDSGDAYTWVWQVKNPINSYDVTFYIGDYVHWSDTYKGEKGDLPLDFYALRYNESKARKQFEEVKPMLHCFEYWLGPYPFYEDGYKLVEAPYLGMEHQSAVAYGNEYKMGYLGMDRSATGVELLFDFIIVHESGHEWFGNSITTRDIADNWIHEGITTYTESLYAECLFGKKKAFEYTRGQWHNIRNDKPVIGEYRVNNEGSGDEYDKGAALVHTIRMMMGNDKKFRKLLHGLNDSFYHKTVTTQQVELYISSFAGIDLKPVFDQYLRTTDIPELEYYVKDNKLHFHFNHVVEGFSLPLEATSGNKTARIRPTAQWQERSWKGGFDISFSKDFLITVKS
ncbi:MAG: M1 family metallopeptidase [Taibaiella sp.]|nr:M1 family metallopeptidase [Taibaiella sp.]